MAPRSLLNKADNKMTDGHSILAGSRIKFLKLKIIYNFISGLVQSEKKTQNKEHILDMNNIFYRT